MNDTFPTIKIELQGMQHTIIHAMSEHLAELDLNVQAAIKEAVIAYDPRETIKAETRRLIDSGIQRAVSDFFNYGDGRDAVKSAIGDYLRRAMNPSSTQKTKK